MSSPSSSSGSSATEAGQGAVVAAVFLLSAAAMADEIVLIRLLSVRFWPHFVSLIVSQAMLGLGASGVAIHALRERIAAAPREILAWLALASGPSFDLAFRASQAVPFDPFLLVWDPAAWPSFALFFLLLAVPFFLCGAAIAVPLSFPLGRPGTVYAAAFAGSAAGAVAALPAFRLLPTESLLCLPLGLGLAAAAFLALEGSGLRRALRAAALAGGALPFLLSPAPLGLSEYKDLAVARRLPEAREIAVRHGPSGDFRALAAPGIHSAPGLSLRFTGDIPPQAATFGDGEARGTAARGGGASPPSFLASTPEALPYRLMERPRVLQLGFRGTEGVQRAALLGAASVTVVEPAGEYAALVVTDLADFSGGWPFGAAPVVRTEGFRNFLARGDASFDVIEIPGVASSTFSSLGIHAAGETFLLTREGVGAALSRLSDRGVLAFSGWLKVPPRESARILGTVRAEMERAGLVPASARLMMVRGWGSFIVLAARRPFGPDSLARARAFCGETGFVLAWPDEAGAPPPAGLSAGEREFRESATPGPSRGGGGLFDLEPVTDDAPYFHRFLRLRAFPAFRRLLGSQWVPFAEWGVVFLLISLAVSILLAVVLLVLPVLSDRRRPGRPGAPFVAYFTALGLGYMVIELTFLKTGVLLFGDAIGAASAAIGGFAFFSGIGSALSWRWEGKASIARRVCPAIALLAATGYLALSAAMPLMLPRGGAARLAFFLGTIAPAAFLMGVPFPAALSLLRREAPGSIPFALAVNGFFSVTGASAASVASLWAGFRATLLGGAALYLVAGALFPRLGGRDRGPAGGDGRTAPGPDVSGRDPAPGTAPGRIPGTGRG